MQLAFNHNQRTLEFGLQMADTLRAGVQVLAETQADCMKALVGSRSLFRNAHVPQLPSPPIEKIEEPPYDEDEDEDDDASKDWLQQLQPVVGVVVQQIIAAIMNRPSSPAPTPTRNVKELIGDALDWRRVAKRKESAPAEPPRTLAELAKFLPPKPDDEARDGARDSHAGRSVPRDGDIHRFRSIKAGYISGSSRADVCRRDRRVPTRATREGRESVVKSSRKSETPDVVPIASARARNDNNHRDIVTIETEKLGNFVGGEHVAAFLCRWERTSAMRFDQLHPRETNSRGDRDLLGHASIVMMMRYAHLAPEVARDAVRLLDSDRRGKGWAAQR